MELTLNKPISLKLDVVDIDEGRLPSFKSRLSFEIPHPTGKLTYSVEDLWFECAVWDAFTMKLGEILQLVEQKEVSLSDMSGAFGLSLTMNENRRSCTFKIQTKEPDTGMGSLCASYEVDILIDDAGLIRESFSDFPVWW